VNKKIAIIGCGNMGEALLKGLVSKKLFTRSRIIISDNCGSRLRFIKKSYRVRVTASNIEAVKKSDIIILALKPQDMGFALSEIAEAARAKLIISNAAGITINYIKKKIGAKRVARVMPNTPALIGFAMTAITVGYGLKKSDIDITESIYACVGETILLNEKDMDAVTAVSGSGPAYFFLLMETMVDAAQFLGLKKDTALKLVTQTAFGASLLQYSLAENPSVLRKNVTSEGGTTEAALKIFKKKGFAAIVKVALKAAAKRSRQLSCR
jgi:pyrroline-5-carboxylate reductase